MSASPVEVTQLPEKQKLFTFGTLVTRLDEYYEMVESAKQAGFDRDDVEFLYIDNSRSNAYDGFSGANKFIGAATGKYLIYCHQDIVFEFDRYEQLVDRISEVDRLDPDWAILGNAGKKKNGAPALRITYSNVKNLSVGNFPERVMTLDENFMIVKMSANIGCSNGINGFHLYGTDLCFNADQLGYSAYVINFHLLHKSAGNPDKTYYDVQMQLMERYRVRKSGVVIQAMCSRFYISYSRLLNKIINNKALLNVHKSLLKKL